MRFWGVEIMGYSKALVACVLFLSASSNGFAQAPVVEASGPTQQQLERMAQAMKECRLETNKMISGLENDPRVKKGEATYHLDGPSGVQVHVDKTTFADFYLASCYQDKLAGDPELNQTNYVADGTPIS